MDWGVAATVVGIITSVVTAAVAIVALIQSGKQARLGSKQFLFDKRLECWIEARRLLILYANNRKSLFQGVERSRRNEPMFANDLAFTFMTNSSKLNRYAPVLKDFENDELRKSFLEFLECLDDFAEKITILFDGRDGAVLARFVLGYGSLLRGMYQYQILVEHMKKNADQWRWTLEQAQENMNEETYRDDVVDAIEKLDRAYGAIEEAEIRKRIASIIGF